MNAQTSRVHFASDNNAGAHPRMLTAIAQANAGHVTGYGGDEYTARAQEAFRELIAPQAQVFFVFNGSGANIVALAAALRPHQAVICPSTAHVAVDECGGFERFAGAKLIDVPVREGKLTPDDVEAQLRGIGDPHHVQPGAITISQTTEVGTVYTIAEMRALADVAHRNGLLLHVDGARLANAAVALDVDLRTLLVETDVDVCSFGGTKNGLLFGEAVVFPRPHPALDVVQYARKQAMQLASKMRFVAAQFDALLREDLWRTNAVHANRMAKLLAERVGAIEGVRIAYPVEANGVFAALPPAAIAPLQRERRFYVWDAEASVVRWMTAFDTTEEDVHDFADAVARVVREVR